MCNRHHLYPKGWRKIAKARREEENDTCELCQNVNGEIHSITGKKTRIHVHHINNDKDDNRKENLLVCCSRCHVRLDLPIRKVKKKEFIMDCRNGVILLRNSTPPDDERKFYREIKRELTPKEISDMQIKLYSPCGCGSGKKFKFCCKVKK